MLASSFALLVSLFCLTVYQGDGILEYGTLLKWPGGLRGQLMKSKDTKEHMVEEMLGSMIIAARHGREALVRYRASHPLQGVSRRNWRRPDFHPKLSA